MVNNIRFIIHWLAIKFSNNCLPSSGLSLPTQIFLILTLRLRRNGGMYESNEVRWHVCGQA